MDKNQLKRLAGIPLKEDIQVNESSDSFQQIFKALIDVGALKSGVDWVDYDDDGRTVKGPDGQVGWFNSGRLSHAVKEFDAAEVRKVVDVLWLLERAKNNDLDKSDYQRLQKLV